MMTNDLDLPPPSSGGVDKRGHRIVAEYRFRKGDRLHDLLFDFLVLYEPVATREMNILLWAKEPEWPDWLNSKDRDPADRSRAPVSVAEMGLQFCTLPQNFLYVPMRGALEHALLSGVAPEFTFRHVQAKPMGPHSVFPPVKSSEQLGRRLEANMAAGMLALFIDRHKPWLLKRYPRTQDWPAPLNFCRVVRNALVHGHGSITWDNPKAPSVSWRGISYGAQQIGRSILGQDVAVADLILLLIESGAALDRINCPRTL